MFEPLWGKTDFRNLGYDWRSEDLYPRKFLDILEYLVDLKDYTYFREILDILNIQRGFLNPEHFSRY